MMPLVVPIAHVPEGARHGVSTHHPAHALATTNIHSEKTTS